VNGALDTNTKLLCQSKKNQKDKSKLKTALSKANPKIAQLQKKVVKSKIVRLQKTTMVSKEDKDDDWKDDEPGSDNDNDGDDDDKGNSAPAQRTPATIALPSCFLTSFSQ